MGRVEVYREWFEQEKASNVAMLGMLESVPVEFQVDPRFERAIVLTAHLAACRENWLDRMVAGGVAQTPWWPEPCTIVELRSRYLEVESRWTAYLSSLTDTELDVDFDFPFSGDRGYRWNIEGQIRQLVGHAFYHRGQIALLVDQVGGTSVDTDYLYWATQQHPERWHEIRVEPS